jgi:hypothetical protein
MVSSAPSCSLRTLLSPARRMPWALPRLPKSPRCPL